ncbi:MULTISPECIES: c-type cytochrome [Sphingobium]|uniref:Cytochrome c n=1 Tax=Sphingobium fuliginis (strain ATCC 27551) TaxID=336203 RepID=A0ABQ1EWE5_SPHSA|nr:MULTISPECIES: c-type cytochrome [Sphingobium]RYL98289.1 c-type cytochrome [Sphingobium fuliginis]WDA35410.1 c-type cytochrome [Sphingobium sp. YC-XJ3]GFZ90352.1 cytochrome c [Sphingobium fuliginis]
MASRPVPSSLVWLAAILLLAVCVTLVAGGAIYLETRAADETRADAMTGGHSERGRAALYRHGCGACHVIPGIDGANGMVGPDLTHVGQRASLAGSLPNDPETMVRWLMHPQALRPGSGMREQGPSERQARDIAAYLYARN